MTFIRMEVTTPKCVRKRNWFVVVVLSRPQKEEWPVARLLSEFYVSSGKLLDCFFPRPKAFQYLQYTQIKELVTLSITIYNGQKNSQHCFVGHDELGLFSEKIARGFFFDWANF